MAAVPTDGVLDNNNSEPLKYKRWVLKVSIHCEGCKRKVKRILHSIEGVYTIDVDARQHKVVVTGNVDANTLIRKLEKSGKHADLWPDFQKVSTTNNNNQVNDHQQQQDVPQNQNQNPNIDNQKVDNNSNKSQKVADNCAQQQQQPPQQQPQQQVKEVRFEGNVPGESPANNPPGGGGSGGDGGGGAKKKKKKKKSNGANNNSTNNGTNNNTNNNNGGGDVANVVMEQGNNGGPASTVSQPPPSNPAHNPNPVSMSPQRHHPPNNRVYEYPYPYYTPPPVYAVSYNTAYPSSNYSTSYYSTPPPYSYAYVHQGGDVEGPAPLDWNPNAVPPSDSFEIFSDENPNACSVM